MNQAMKIRDTTKPRLKPGAVGVLLLGLIYFFLPLVATFVFSLKGLKDVLSFYTYLQVFQDSHFVTSFLFSLEMALGAIVIGIALMLPTALLVHLRFPKLKSLMEIVCLLPFVVPPIVLAYGLIRIYGREPLVLTGSPLLLVFAYVAISYPYLYRAIDTGLRSIDVKRLSEAARTLGASWFTTLWTVIIPNIRTALLSAAFLTFAIVMGELTLALLLAWPAFGPYMAQVSRDDAHKPAALALLSFALTWFSLYIMDRLTRGNRRT